MNKDLLSLTLACLLTVAFGLILSESVVHDPQDDRDGQRVDDFWGGTRILYQMTSVPEGAPDPREQDREWCHVNDFWTAEVQELYGLSSDAAATEGRDPSIRLIELSITASDEGCGAPD